MDAPLHPAELAYAFAYSRTETVIGWGDAFAQPADAADGSQQTWLADGEARLREAGRLVGDPEAGLNFTDEMVSLVLALANPSLVLLAERKDDHGVRKRTVHAVQDRLFGLSRRADGLFDVTHYADVMTAAGACAGFLGATLTAPAEDRRVDSTEEIFAKIQSGGAAHPDKAAQALQALGLPDRAAQSAAQALLSPAVAGVMSTLYCANNEVQDAEVLTVLTTQDEDTWVLFFPASPEGPMVLEQSSASGITARVAVDVMARLGAANDA